MKKVLVVILLCMFSIISLVYLYRSTDVLDFIKYSNNIEIDEAKLEDNYYYKNLTDVEKTIYKNITYMVNNFQTDIKIKVDINKLDIQQITSRAMEAYRYDNPEIFYLDSLYETQASEYGKILGITVHYTITDKQKIEAMKRELDLSVERIIYETIEIGMSDFEKELAIHDYLAKNVAYYSYGNIVDIPYDMHSSYNAIVKREAVCDGISKAFQIIMKKIGIKCITVSGELEGTLHAWNIVKIDGQYAHVDITSDKYNTESSSSNSSYMHPYFNVDDSAILYTHRISTKYVLPQCNASGLEYYNNENTIYFKEDFESKLRKIVENNTNPNILEIKIKNNDNVAAKLIKYLYEMNFNNYQGRGITTLKYSVINNVYIIPIS